METLSPAPTTEQVRTPQEVFRSIIDIDPKSVPEFTAVDHIKDTPTAKLFLEGCAEQTALHTEDESIRERPLETVYGNIRYVVGHKVDTKNPDKTPGEQFGEMIAPWAEAYKQFPSPQRVERSA